MTEPAIRAHGVSKRYHIGRRQEGFRTLRDSVASALTAPFRRAGRLLRGDAWAAADLDETIWALRDISLEVSAGEALGVIGRNGAGKSTLLKVLSRITEPTTGYVELRGRVGSLLEVGTGFHPELTGRDNVFLNGAILGMSRSEIVRRFDEIVAFAEVEKFLDTPVKHYSSGMYLRLAFAVAAHLDPEILIVDEVLAVGDAGFQKKCLGKMQDVEREGRTVIFVSHNMSAVTRLCRRAVLLDGGRVVREGPASSVVAEYLDTGLRTTACRVWPEGTGPGDENVRLCGVRIRDEAGNTVESVDVRSPFGIEMEYEVLRPEHQLLPHYHLFNDEGVQVFSVHDVDPGWRGRRRPRGRYRSTAWIPGNLLSEGMLFVNAGLVTLDPVIPVFHEVDAVAFHVFDDGTGDSARGDWPGSMRGAVRPLLRWSTDFAPPALAVARALEPVLEEVD